MDIASIGGFGLFLFGLVIGLVTGFVMGPVARYWIAWREWRDASDRARLTEASLKRTAEGPWSFRARPRTASSRPGDLHPNAR
jgi:hypothetical protein